MCNLPTFICVEVRYIILHDEMLYNTATTNGVGGGQSQDKINVTRSAASPLPHDTNNSQYVSSVCRPFGSLKDVDRVVSVVYHNIVTI